MHDMNRKVHIRQLSKRFGPQTVLNQIELERHDGEFLTLLGPSGCGKTTLLRAIAGFYTPDEGCILVDGKDITHQPPHQRDIGMVFQSYAVFPHMTVAQNVAYGLQARKLPTADIQRRVSQALERVQLGQLGQRYASQLSGGQKQRVCIARALAAKPKLILCDEVTSALDPLVADGILKLLLNLQAQEGVAYLFITHDLATVKAIADKIAVMYRGKVVRYGQKSDVLAPPFDDYTDLLLSSVPEMKTGWLEGVLKTRKMESAGN
jgi:peptide/nickel transport system ATP-binding protein